VENPWIKISTIKKYDLNQVLTTFEHALGKGEVDSSILSGSTSPQEKSPRLNETLHRELTGGAIRIPCSVPVQPRSPRGKIKASFRPH
jgi:hypothetical protein